MSMIVQPEGTEPVCGESHGDTRKAPVPPEILDRAAALFRAAGDPARLWLLERLSGGERCVTDLAEESGDALSTVSQRLRVLRNEKLVRGRREGKHVFYELLDAHVAELIRSAIDHAREDR